MAALIALREDIEAKKILFEHFYSSLKIIFPSISPEILRFYENLEKKFRNTLLETELHKNISNYDFS